MLYFFCPTGCRWTSSKLLLLLFIFTMYIAYCYASQLLCRHMVIMDTLPRTKILEQLVVAERSKISRPLNSHHQFLSDLLLLGLRGWVITGTSMMPTLCYFGHVAVTGRRDCMTSQKNVCVWGYLFWILHSISWYILEYIFRLPKKTDFN